MLRKKSRRSSRGNGPVTLAKRAATLEAREKLQRAIAPSSRQESQRAIAHSSRQESQRAIAPPPSSLPQQEIAPPPSPLLQRAIAPPPSPPLQRAIAPFASSTAALFSIPSFASGGPSTEQLIEDSTTVSAYLEAHAAAHKSFARVL